MDDVVARRGRAALAIACAFAVRVLPMPDAPMPVCTAPRSSDSSEARTLAVRCDGQGTLPLEGAVRLLFDLGLDPNRADAESLMVLPGVGEMLALRIVQARAVAPFRRAEDLRRVPGVGPRTLERMRPFLVFPPAAPVDPWDPGD